jgi:hypothetical protein
MDLQNEALYGDRPNTSLMGATMLNGYNAQDQFDWGAVLANGIRGAAQGAMAASVNGAYQSGQLVSPGLVTGRGQGINLVTLLLLGGLVYVAVKA